MTKATHFSVIVIGGGQAGLSVSHELKRRDVHHVVLEKNRIGHSWRNDRWDSFCLVTPNWQCRLPDFPYNGSDPKGFMLKDEIVAYLEDFARMVDPPIREGVAVTRVGRGKTGVLEVDTSEGPLTADHVVVATGGYDVPIVPAYAHGLDKSIAQIHSVDYRNPDQLPPGEVLVVGSGQSGVQIMEDLYLAGRKVHLCVGPAPRSPRVYRGRETTEWLMEMGYYALTIDKHPQGEKAKEKTNHYLSGRAGGHEIDLRRFARDGVSLYGSVAGIDGTTVRFANDLATNLDDADEVYVSIRRDIDAFIAAKGIDAPAEPPFVPVWQPQETPLAVDCAAQGISAIVWAIGFRPNYAWIELPVFDGRGAPKYDRGVAPVEGLYFIGLPWLHTWGSGRFLGIGEDAAHLAGVMHARLSTRAAVAA